MCGIVPQRFNNDQEEAICKEKPERCPELGPHSSAGALAFLSTLSGEKGSARPFATEAQALAEAHERQKRRSEEADLRVGGQKPDAKRCDPHSQQRPDEGGLAADAVTEVTENH